MKHQKDWFVTGSIGSTAASGTGTRLATVSPTGVFGGLTNGANGSFCKISGSTPVFGSIADADLPSVISGNARVQVQSSSVIVGTRRAIQFLHSGLGSTSISDDPINERVIVTVIVPSSHAHAASDITTGNLDIARLPSGLASCSLGDVAVGTGSNTWGKHLANTSASPKFLQCSGSILAWNYPVRVSSGTTPQMDCWELKFTDTSHIVWSFLGGTHACAIFATIASVPSHSHSASDISSGTLSSSRMPNVSGWSSQGCSSSKTVLCGATATLSNLSSVLSTLINDLRTVGVLTT